MRTISAVLVLAASTSAQSFNVDLGGVGVPSTGYAAAGTIATGGNPSQELPPAGTGPWNAVPLSSSPTSLISTTGLSTNVTLTSTATSSFAFTTSALTGDDRELMLDGEITAAGATTTYTFTGLSAGFYYIYTYAWNPTSQSAQTRVSVPGSVDPDFDVGATWNGSPHVFLGTYAVHSALIHPGGTIVVVVQGVGGPGVVNGFQIRSDVSGANFCWADGSGSACPCGNSAIRPHGCANSVQANGSELVAVGYPRVSFDTLVLRCFWLPPTSNALFFQGTSRVAGGLGVPFGDGLRCVGGATARLGIASADSQNAWTYPQTGGTPVSIAGALTPGDVRHYQVFYRDANPSFCTVSTFNLTNGVTVVWQP